MCMIESFLRCSYVLSMCVIQKCLQENKKIIFKVEFAISKTCSQTYQLSF